MLTYGVLICSPVLSACKCGEREFILAAVGRFVSAHAVRLSVNNVHCFSLPRRASALNVSFISAYVGRGTHIILKKRKALRKQGLDEKTAASVLLKLFISGNERCHTTDAP